MEAVVCFVLTGTHGGANRARIVRALDERPLTVDELGDTLDLGRETVSDHLDVLRENDVVEERIDEEGVVYLPTEQVRRNWGSIAGVIGRSEA